MAVIITRMPSTGDVTNITHTPSPVDEVRARWADVDCVQVIEDVKYDALPTRPTRGEWTALRRCNDCR